MITASLKVYDLSNESKRTYNFPGMEIEIDYPKTLKIQDINFHVIEDSLGDIHEIKLTHPYHIKKTLLQ